MQALGTKNEYLINHIPSRYFKTKLFPQDKLRCEMENFRSCLSIGIKLIFFLFAIPNSIQFTYPLVGIQWTPQNLFAVNELLCFYCYHYCAFLSYSRIEIPKTSIKVIIFGLCQKITKLISQTRRLYTLPGSYKYSFVELLYFFL